MPGPLPVKQGSLLRAWLVYVTAPKAQAIPDYINGIDLEWAPEHAISEQAHYISLANSNAMRGFAALTMGAAATLLGAILI